MDLTEQEANYFESLPPPTGPSPFGLKPKKPSARPRSNSLRLKSSPYKVPSSLTGPPSPSRTSRSTPDLRWFSRSRKTKSVHSHPLSFSAPLPSNHTDTRSNPFSLRPPSVNWDGFGPGSSAQKQAKTSLWAAIRKAGVPIYLDTPGFDMFSLCPSALGTYCSPTEIRKIFDDSETFYHAYSVGKKLSADELAPSKCGTIGGCLQHVADAVLAEYGAALIDWNAGPHFTFINFDPDERPDGIILRARQLIQRFQEKVIITIPATESGLHATRSLSEEGILVNLSMVTGISHAAACAEAGAAWITFHLDELEKVFEERSQLAQDIQTIQATIALYDMHNVNTKIMINGFSDPRRILDFPGAHGFCMARDQIVIAQHPTTRLYRVPIQAASSLEENVINLAKDEKWPPQFFDVPEAGGSNGSLVRHLPSNQELILFFAHMEFFCQTNIGTRDFMVAIRDYVINYKTLMMQLSHPRIGFQTLKREGVKALRNKVNRRQDLRTAECEWRATIAGRLLPEIEWEPFGVDSCDVRIARDGRIEATIPEDWDRREMASMNLYATY